MKKLIAIMLSLVLCTALVIPASAATITSQNGSTSETVYAKVVDNTTDVYSVEIEWSSMTFKYEVNNGTWNPETLKYGEDGTEGTWKPVKTALDETDYENAETGDQHYVKVTNKSNVALLATLTAVKSELESTGLHVLKFPSGYITGVTGVTGPSDVDYESQTACQEAKIGLASAVNPDNPALAGTAASVKAQVIMNTPPWDSLYLASGYQAVGTVKVTLADWNGLPFSNSN